MPTTIIISICINIWEFHNLITQYLVPKIPLKLMKNIHIRLLNSAHWNEARNKHFLHFYKKEKARNKQINNFIKTYSGTEVTRKIKNSKYIAIVIRFSSIKFVCIRNQRESEPFSRASSEEAAQDGVLCPKLLHDWAVLPRPRKAISTATWTPSTKGHRPTASSAWPCPAPLMRLSPKNRGDMLQRRHHGEAVHERPAVLRPAVYPISPPYSENIETLGTKFCQQNLWPYLEPGQHHPYLQGALWFGELSGLLRWIWDHPTWDAEVPPVDAVWWSWRSQAPLIQTTSLTRRWRCWNYLRRAGERRGPGPVCEEP